MNNSVTSCSRELQVSHSRTLAETRTEYYIQLRTPHYQKDNTLDGVIREATKMISED